MINFNIEDVQNILRKCNVNDLVVHPHILDNWFERDYNLNYVANCLVNEVPLSISKTCENRFKLIYPHEKNKNDDLYIYGLRENQLVEVLYKTFNFIVILFDDSVLYLNKSEVKEIYVKAL